MCEYCNSTDKTVPDQPLLDDTDELNMSWYVTLIDNYINIDLDCGDDTHGGQTNIKINYCPRCGRELKEKK